ncbi:hypothetical protein D3C87_390110 [compost metagenome]
MPAPVCLRPGSCVRRADQQRRRSIGIRPYQVGWSVIGVSAAVVRGNALVPRRAISAGWCARPLTPSVGNATGLVAAGDPGKRSAGRVGSQPTADTVSRSGNAVQWSARRAGRFPATLSSITKKRAMPAPVCLRPGSCVRRADQQRRRSIGIRPYQVGWSVIGVSAAVVRGNALVPRRAISAGWCARPLTPSVGNATGLVAAGDPGKRSAGRVGSQPTADTVSRSGNAVQWSARRAGRFPATLSSITKNGRCWRPPISGRGHAFVAPIGNVGGRSGSGPRRWVEKGTLAVPASLRGSRGWRDPQIALARSAARPT